LKDGEVELQDSIKRIEKEDVVLTYLLKNKTSKRKLFNLIRLYGTDKFNKMFTMNTPTDVIYTNLREVANTPKGINNLFSIISVDEKQLSLKILVQDALTSSIIERKGYDYYLNNGEKIGSNEDEVITYLLDKGNSATKIRVEQEIDLYYKNNS